MKCIVIECNEEAYCRGLCKKHYSRFMRTGVTSLIKKPKKECSVDGCGCSVIAKGYCRKHYDQFRKYGEIRQINHNFVCKVCGREATSKGFCKKHYNDYYRGKIDIDGKNIGNISSKTIDK